MMKKKKSQQSRIARSARRPRRTTRHSGKRFTAPDCRRFTGYKPCFPGSQCYKECVDPAPYGTSILIVNLDAMGNVLVTTSILQALKRKYPDSHISWVTLKNAAPLLENNPYLDAVYLWEPESWLILQQMRFDLVLNVDKSRRSGALVQSLRSPVKLGYGIDDRGVIVPLNPEAMENYVLGLDDHLKFRVNRKTVPQLLCEQFRLDYQRDRYVLTLSEEERSFCTEYARNNSLPVRGETPGALVVGFNTGCSELYPNKKMTVEQHVALIRNLSGAPGVRLLLLGGPEDTLRNAEIARRSGDSVLSTPTTEGLRRGLCYISLCDVVVTGDSFGMHAAIGFGKHVIVWFGVSCPAEVDLFDRGMKLIPEGLECSPCWKRSCPYNLECISMIDLRAIEGEVLRIRGGRGLV